MNSAGCQAPPGRRSAQASSVAVCTCCRCGTAFRASGMKLRPKPAAPTTIIRDKMRPMNEAITLIAIRRYISYMILQIGLVCVCVLLLLVNPQTKFEGMFFFYSRRKQCFSWILYRVSTISTIIKTRTFVYIIPQQGKLLRTKIG